MNQIGFVEISHVKNERLYRALLPMGVQWTEALEALKELSQQVTDHIKESEAAELLKKEQEAASQALDSEESDKVIEASPAE